MQNEVSFWKIFTVFAKIGAFTIGGGYMIIPAIQAEMSRRHWIADEELPDIIAIAQSAPGLLAVNMSIFAGYRLKGVKGSIVATLGSVLPSFLIILIIAMCFSSFQDNPVVLRIFQGIRPVVVSLIAVPTVKLAKQCNHSWWAWCISIAAMLAIAFLKVSPVYILLTLMACALALALWRERKFKEGRR